MGADSRPFACVIWSLSLENYASQRKKAKPHALSVVKWGHRAATSRHSMSARRSLSQTIVRRIRLGG